MDALYKGVLRDRATHIIWQLHERSPKVLAKRDPEDAIQQAISTIRKLRSYGVVSGPEVARLTRWELILQCLVEDFGSEGYVVQILQSDLRDSRKADLIEEQINLSFCVPAGG